MRAAVLLVAAVVSLTGCATVAAGAPAPDSEVAAIDRASADAPAIPSPEMPSASPGSPSASPGSPSASPGSPSASPSGSATLDRTASAGQSAEPKPPPTPSPSMPASDPAPPGSFVLGDSIGLAVAPILSRFGYPVTGRVGQSAHAAFLQQYLAGSVAQAAPGWVIVLGTNNRGDEFDIARLPEWIDLIADLRSPGAKQQVYWVTPHRPDAYAGGLSAYRLDDFNAELARLAADRRWLHVVDFDAASTGHPEWFAEDGGRLHPNLDGQQALAAMITGPDAIPVASPAAITTLEWPSQVTSEAPVFDNGVD